MYNIIHKYVLYVICIYIYNIRRRTDYTERVLKQAPCGIRRGGAPAEKIPSVSVDFLWN